MKAIVCHEYGTPDQLKFDDVPSPHLGPNQVRVKVKNVGINYVDGLLVSGSYQIKVPPPFTPGSDLSGEIIELGAEVDQWQLGDRVLADLGIGALCEEVVVAPGQLTAIPEGMSDALGAVFLQANSTAYYALHHCGQLKLGETLLVLGAAGGTGMAAIHLAKAQGARVIAAASTPEKLAACKAAGADETINYNEESLKDRAKALSDGGVDMVFDPVGGEFAEPALRACAPGGRYLVIGFVGGPIPNIPLNLPLLKRCSIVGVNWGASFMADPSLIPQVHGALLELFEAGKLPAPPLSEFSFQEAGQAIAALHSRQVTGRAVVRVATG